MPVKAQYSPVLITDLDGTLIQSMPIAWSYLEREALKQNKTLQLYSEYTSTLHLYWDVITTFKLSSLALPVNMRSYMYLKDPEIREYQGAMTGLKKLIQQGWVIVVITDNDEEYAKRVLQRNGLDIDQITILGSNLLSKWKNINNTLRQYRAHPIFFASHDRKDFLIASAAALLQFKQMEYIFTPNEIDKTSFVKNKYTIAEFAEKIIKDQT